MGRVRTTTTALSLTPVFHSRISLSVTKNFSTKKFTLCAFALSDEGLTKVEHFQQLDKRKKNSSAANVCKKMTSFSIFSRAAAK